MFKRGVCTGTQEESTKICTEMAPYIENRESQLETNIIVQFILVGLPVGHGITYSFRKRQAKSAGDSLNEVFESA